MKIPKIFSFKKFTNKSGKLLPISFNRKFPIKVKIIFLIYGKRKYKRGDHAHKKCSQVFFPIKGKIKVNIKYKRTEKSIFLSDNQSKALLVPPIIWSSVEFVTSNAIVLVINDQEYDYEDYLHTYEEFMAYQEKNK